LLAAEAEAGNQAWLTAVRLGRPHVTWKYAATLDGRIAAADGTSRWISSAESRADAHTLRAHADAVIAGSGTLIADDPHLAARDVPGARQPLRVIVDTNARTRTDARVLDDAAPTLIAVGPQADAAHLPGSLVLRVPRAGTGLDLHTLLKELYARDVRAVLLEGGPTLAGAFAAAGLIDAVVGYLAPTLLGAGPAVLGPAGIATITEALRLNVHDVTRLGPDLRITARIEPAPATRTKES
ncbi:bifunctional diaminohydroxyphosphoribosylaminopyrimidine deaminase/5-amino-6-(5-phosphoribosylamino)uracil reductase RibD, partial [Streptomyces sp. SID3343]|uniref:bifunctional diaminohydroxyphosphoribosylaminopyrimidine deaminase/5-amino-6-(5-phosphoribosylamino)uracil reductase RibD n=1 Tax=Streptomyces sp. SID3343 TaxID=2690260 RepID=UPI00136D7BB8